MKMFYNGTPVNSMKVHHYELDTNSATVQPSDMQSGVTCFARGKKITGTGKSFSFAVYGDCPSNVSLPIPVSVVNTVNIGSEIYAVKLTNRMYDFRGLDFSTEKIIARINIDGNDYDISMKVVNNMLTISCNKNVTLQIMLGKDEHII